MNTALGRAVRSWLLARSALATVVLGLTLSFFLPAGSSRTTVTPMVLIATVLLTIASSFAMAAGLQRGVAAVSVGRFLMFADVAAVTATVCMTGGAGSVLAVLYGAVIVGAATTVGARAAFAAGGLSLAAYGVCGLGMALGYLPSPSDQPVHQYLLPPDDLAFAGLSNLTAMFVVTLLSSWLAEQLHRTGGALADSEKQRIELSARNEDIVRSIGAGLITLDRDDRVGSLNPAGAEMLRIETGAAIGRPLTDFFPSLPTGSGVREESVALRADHSTFPVGYSMTELLDAEGAPSGRLLTYQDLTEIRALEKAAQEAERLATLGRVAAGLAHEIRNPLSSILGSVELVRDHAPLDEEDKKLLGIVLKEVERLDDLVDAMLNVARPRKASLGAFDLAGVANDVCTIASTGVGTAVGVAIVSRLERPCPVVADASMVRQILWNLVKNAVQCSTPGASVEVVLERPDASTVRIEVRDQGPGIAEAERERIFDAFHTSRTRGVGLGLTVVRQLVEAHHGTIEVTPNEPTGSVFRVTLPAAPAGGPSVQP